MEEEFVCPKLPWMVDFHCSAKGKIPNAQFKAAFADDYIDHLCKLNIDSEVPRARLTGIICTMGPSCMDPKVIENMIGAGMAMVNIKMSHCTIKDCAEMLDVIQRGADNFGKKFNRVFSLGIIVDLKGPEIRTGVLKNPEVKHLELRKGNEITLTSDPAYEEFVTEDMIYVDYQKIIEVIEPGDKIILIDDIERGQIQLSALKIVGSVIRCLIENTGHISNHASVCLEGIATDLPALTDFDVETLKFCATKRISAVLLGQVQSSENINEVRKILGKEGRSVMVVAKIQNPHHVYNIDEILKASDGIVIDRSSLSMEFPLEKLFLLQKLITGKCIKVGLPVICANNVLETMSQLPQPTTAEITDVGTAVSDGIDCFLLSKETAVGKYPVQAINVLSSICKEAEAATYQKSLFDNLSKTMLPVEPLYAFATAATEASMKCNAAAIIVTTVSGRSAKVISNLKPRCPIIAVTRFGHIAEALHIWRGVHPLHYIKKPLDNWLSDVERRIQFGVTYGKRNGYIAAGDAIIIIRGSKSGSGFTDSMRIAYASEYDTVKTAQQ